MKVGIVGYGYVGKGMQKIFKDAVIYDEPMSIGDRDSINGCDLAIVCVPTPMRECDSEFKEADTSIIEDVIEWINTPLILIKSTVPPETTARLREKTGKHICFSPEYMGESKYQITPWKYMSPTEPLTHEFVIIGGERKDRENIANIFMEVLGAEKTYYLCESTEAEMIKYLENSFFALKVAFFNEIFDLCKALGISYHSVREGWALDNRVNKMHSAVFVNNRKIGGKCFPKDVNAIVAKAKSLGVELHLLEDTIRYHM